MIIRNPASIYLMNTNYSFDKTWRGGVHKNFLWLQKKHKHINLTWNDIPCKRSGFCPQWVQGAHCLFSDAHDAFNTWARERGASDGCSCSSHHLTPDRDSGDQKVATLKKALTKYSAFLIRQAMKKRETRDKRAIILPGSELRQVLTPEWGELSLGLVSQWHKVCIKLRMQHLITNC